jgi:hypothetical protein
MSLEPTKVASKVSAADWDDVGIDGITGPMLNDP